MTIRAVTTIILSSQTKSCIHRVGHLTAALPEMLTNLKNKQKFLARLRVGFCWTSCSVWILPYPEILDWSEEKLLRDKHSDLYCGSSCDEVKKFDNTGARMKIYYEDMLNVSSSPKLVKYGALKFFGPGFKLKLGSFASRQSICTTCIRPLLELNNLPFLKECHHLVLAALGPQPKTTKLSLYLRQYFLYLPVKISRILLKWVYVTAKAGISFIFYSTRILLME